MTGMSKYKKDKVKNMSKCNFFYTNMSDSVIFAGFKGHQYGISGDNDETISELYKKSLIDFLTLVNNDKNSDAGVVLTLNQICDNRFLNFENQNETFNLLSELIIKGKLKISYYNEYNLVTYTLDALKKCIKRLSKGNTAPDMLYISSLFSELGIDNGDSVSRRRLMLLLGYDLSYIEYIENDIFRLKDDKPVDFNYFEEKSVFENKYGLYTALKKYADNPKESSWLTSQNLWTLNKIKIEISSITWIKNLVELNNLAKEYNALVPNVSKCTLKKVMSGLLSNEELINEKLDFWLGSIKNKEAIKDGIKEILKKLIEDSNRTAMYINIRTYMKEFAENHKDDENLFKKFNTSTNTKTKKLPYQRVFFTILNVVDYAYNLLNMFFSTSDCTIVEGFINFKSEDRRIMHKNNLQISSKHYEFDENGTLTVSESDNLQLNNMIKNLLKSKDENCYD